MKNKNILSFVKRYLVFFMAALLLASSVIVSSVFGKYTSTSEQTIDINVEAYGEIGLSLCDGAVAANAWSESAHELFVVPGTSIEFDPYVRVTANSEECYLFVRVTNGGGSVTVDETEYGFSDFLQYTVAAGWTQGDGTSIPADVYYRTVSASGSDQFFGVITDDAVTVPADVTEAILNSFTESTKPTVTISAYAVQITNLTDPNRDNATAAGAWAWINAQ